MMGAGIFFIALGVVAGTIGAWCFDRCLPQIKSISEIKLKDRPYIWGGLTLATACLLTVLAFAIFRLSQVVWSGNHVEFWEDDALIYQRLTNFSSQQIFLGLLIGTLVYTQVKLYRTDDLKERQLRLRRALNVPIYGLAAFALLSPYLDRLLPNATSVEISTIGKITFDSRQQTQSQSGTFIAGPGGTGSIQVGANDISSAIDNIVNISTDGQSRGDMKRPSGCQGMMQRDLEYIQIINKINSGDNTHKESEPTQMDNLKSDIAFFQAMYPAEICLRNYSTRYLDYRLLLIDIKPFIQALSALINRPENAKNAGEVSDLVKDSLVNLLTQAQKYIKLAGDETKVCSRAQQVVNATDFAPHVTMNSLPYKTILLSYVLNAVGSTDRAVLEVATWIESNKEKVHPWYLTRAQIELAILLANSLPDAERNPVYYNYVSTTFPSYEHLLGNPQLEKWSVDCQAKPYFERLLMSSYTSAANAYVKASANLDRISPAVLKTANNVRKIDLSCFRDIQGFSAEEKGWQAALLTNYASALLAASYSDRMFGKDEGEAQKKLRQDARRDLVEALRLLDSYDQEHRQADRPISSGAGASSCKAFEEPALSVKSEADDASKRAQEVLARPKWGEVRLNAQGLLRKLIDGAN